MSAGPREAAAPGEAEGLRASDPGPASGGAGAPVGEEETAPCLRCGIPLPVRLMGCRGGHCPNCGHPYPHGDCSD